jgi:putative hydrolase of the HAD superfamily
MKTRQLFFDLDRTLWDFERNSQFALSELYHDLKLGEHIEHFLQFHHHYVLINSELWHQYGKGKISKEELRDSRFAKTLAKFGIHDENIATRMSTGYIDLSPNQTAIFPHVHEVLKELKSNDYRLHMITNGFREVQERKLQNCDLKQYFDVVLCSEDIGFTKPNREIYREAERLTLCKPEHAIMIGDDFKADVIGSLNAGWTAIHFDPERKYKKERNVPRIRGLNELPEVVSMLPISVG